MRGFSLLELILVLAIVATLAAIASPRYGYALARYRAEAAARRVAADLELARATAKADSTSVTVMFNLADNRYELIGVTSLDRDFTDAELVLSDEPYRSRLVAAGFNGNQVVVFDGYGVPDSGGTVVVSCGSVTRIVELDQHSGKATMQ